MDLAPLIDSTDLRPQATREDVRELAREARRHGFKAVCANLLFVPLLADELDGSAVRVATVCGFPLGATPTEVKVLEARRAVEWGAHEVDMVAAIGDLAAGRRDAVLADILAVREAAEGAVLKVILECGVLSADQMRAGAELVVEAGADFVKTSTGFGPSGAREEDVRLLRETVGPDFGVKAAGGIRTREQALAMVRAGADRIGTSSGPAIVSEGSA